MMASKRIWLVGLRLGFDLRAASKTSRNRTNSGRLTHTDALQPAEDIIGRGSTLAQEHCGLR